MSAMPALVVLGARNLGRAVLHHFRADGWEGAAVARSAASLAGLDGIGIRADASDPDELRAALEKARERLGGLDLIVNAVSASRPPRDGGPFGGGPLAEATLAGFRGWSAAVSEQAFVFLSEGGKALRAAGGGGTLIQVTGGSARRAMPGRGLWASGAAATRALTHAAAQEWRAERIHVALLVVDATIASPKTEERLRGTPEDESAAQEDVARAVAALAAQTPRGYTHELVITPAGDRWVP
jgi:NAD(P)-dependent dehydrogenase (short-subunit alcohol dehydrogenase family)